MKIANIINILRKLSGWIVEDKENNKYNSDMKFITVDLISNNFVCEACEYAIKHRLRKTKQKQLQLSPANKNIRTTIKKHLNKSEFHAKSVRFHYITRNNATILLNNAKILNFDGYSYNKDRETYLKGTFTIYFDCSKANCSGRAQVVNNLFILSNNGHNCNSNKFLDAIINQCNFCNEIIQNRERVLERGV
uniref:Zf-3CxxC domain-containing protein n=1 Tax=Meloidogyne hapla TaxID=6305 RepID=A0A1I8C1R2_MELHA